MTGIPAGHSLLLWAAREPDQPVVRLVCAEAADDVVAGRDEAVVVWRGCLTTLPLALPFELLEIGIGQVLLDHCGCEAEWTAWDELAAVARVGDRLQVVTEPDPDGKRPKKLLDADAMPVLRRRSIFGLGAVSQEPDPELPDLVGTPQQRLRGVVQRLAGAASVEPVEAPEGGWTSGALDLASKGCVACRVCVRVCPEGALALESSGTRAGLGFDASLCTGCGKCLPVCDVRALSAAEQRLGPPALFASTVLLELFDVRTCARCRAEFRGEGEYCPVCAFRMANPFASTFPPGGYQRPTQ